MQMLRTYEYRGKPKIQDSSLKCRMCLSQYHGMLDIFCLESEPTEPLTTVAIIKYCIGVECTEDDGLPRRLCIECYSNLMDFFAFKRMCLASENHFKVSRVVALEKAASSTVVSEPEIKQECDDEFSLGTNSDMVLLETDSIDPGAPDDVLSQIKWGADEEEETIPPEIFPLKTVPVQASCSQVNTPPPECFGSNSKIDPHNPGHEWDETDEDLPLEMTNEEMLTTNVEITTTFEEMTTINEEMTATDEEMTATDEEMTATNEEMTTINEEMITSTEEMTTANEEMTTANEEMTTANEEMTTTNEEITTINGADLNSLISPIDSAEESRKSVDETPCPDMPETTPKVINILVPVNSFPCEKCSKTFNNFASLHRHQKRLHGGKKFSCPQCGKVFVQKDSLKRHGLTHTPTESRFICSTCSKILRSREGLKCHLRTHHSDRTSPNYFKYVCKKCDKKFAHASGLSRHKTIHLGIRYPCEYCPKKFNDSSQMRRHQRTHHVKVRESNNDSSIELQCTWSASLVGILSEPKPTPA